MTTDKKARRDKLGFAITPKPATELIGQDTPAPPVHQGDEDYDIEEDDELDKEKPEEEDDIFGFEKQGATGKDGSTTAQQ